MIDAQINQLATDLARLADAMEIIAKHLAPDAAKALGHRRLPNLRRPLTEYASFDWSSIGANVVAKDRSGPTEVDYRGTVCKRRTGEDKKGKAIWFNVVTGGTVSEGNITYERLITFRDSTPAEPLGDKVQADIDKARKAAQPAQPEGQMAVPLQPSAPLKKAEPPSLYDQLVAAHSEALKIFGNIPVQYQPDTGDKPADIQRKIDGLKTMIANSGKPTPQRTPEESEKFAAVCKQLAELTQWAQQHQIAVPPHLAIQPTDETINVEMKLGTLTQLCAPAKSQFAGMRSELNAASQSAVEHPAVSGDRVAQLIAWLTERMKKYDAGKKNNLVQRGLTVEAINAVTEGKAVQVIQSLFRCAIEQMNSAQSMALFDYVKPSKHEGHTLPANINAAETLNELLHSREKAA